jgi:hypothetical protein
LIICKSKSSKRNSVALQDGISVLSQAEAASSHESKEGDYIKKVCNILGFIPESDNNIEAEPKKLLPSMNRVWPHLVLCLKHQHTAVCN